MTAAPTRYTRPCDAPQALQPSAAAGLCPFELLAPLLPPTIACCETSTYHTSEPLWPVEHARATRYAHGRLAEFATARACARHALQSLGIPPCALPVGEHREPLWPAGIAGSITHCRGYRGAAVMRRGTEPGQAVGIGIDAEVNEAVDAIVRPQIATPAELAVLDDLAGRWPQVVWDRMLFSAKESVYKAWYPQEQRWLGFLDCVLMVGGPTSCTQDTTGVSWLRGTFTAHLLPASSLGPELVGNWVARLPNDAAMGGLIATALVIYRERA